jgi:hypothetical protein
MTEAQQHRSAEFRSRLDALDVSLFKAISSQTELGDRASLLALQSACGQRHGRYAFLEIGSHLGGSMQAFVRDDRVESVLSIDLRPELTPDDRGKNIPYRGNSTQRMLDLLATIPGADLTKLHTIDADTRALAPDGIPVRPQLCFIDGEHTYESCLADARFCRQVLAPDGAIAFHDAPIVFPAIATFLRELRREGIHVLAYPLPERMFVIELDNAELHRTAAMHRLLSSAHNNLPGLARALAAHPRLGLALRPVLVRLWLSRLGVGRPALRRQLGKMVKVHRRRLVKRSRSWGRRAASRLSRVPPARGP